MQERKQHEALWLFREELYHLGFERRRDALVELLDALLVAGRVPAFVHLSLAQLFRRKWGSAYDALAAGRLNEPVLRQLVSRYPWTMARLCTRWTPASGHGAMRSAAPSEASITPPAVNPQGSRSWPAGRTPGWPS